MASWRRESILAMQRSSLLPLTHRARALSLLGVTVGATVSVYPGLRLQHGTGLSIGSNSLINADCFISAAARVDIGANVWIADGVSLNTATHRIGEGSRRAGEVIRLPIRVGDGSWIGSRSVILGGVTIGSGCVVAAGSVVIRDCEANSLYAGVPAVLKRRLQD